MEREPQARPPTLAIGIQASLPEEEAFWIAKRPMLISIARSFGRYYDDEDVAQAVILNVIAKSLCPSDAMLWTLTKNKCLDLRRRDRVRKAAPLHADSISYAESNDELLDARKELIIRFAFETATERQNEILSLYYQKGLNQNEIAEKMGIHQSAVSKMLSKLSCQIRAYIEHHEQSRSLD